MTTILLVLAVLLLAAMAYVRFTPVSITAAGPTPTAAAPGDYPTTGGFLAVRAMDGLPSDALQRLDAIVMYGPRVVRRSGDAETLPMIYETRSRFWLFPDINTIWVHDGLLHVHAHLVYGRSDLGANQARILGWLERL